MALSQQIPLPFSVAMAEAMAAHQATLFAQELSFSKVMMEGDCLQVVSALNSKVNCNTLYGNVVEETRHQASKFHFCSFNHVHRGGNKLARTLVGKAVSLADLDVWVGELSFDLESVFQIDFS